MKTFATIVLAGTVAFLAISMTQEWEVFARGFGPPEGVLEGPPPVPEIDRQSAEAALRSFLALERHYFGTAGDPRFLDRMAAGEGVRAELVADVEYLSRNGRFQEMELFELRTIGVSAPQPERLELRTREYWVVRTLSLGSGEETDPVWAEVVDALYRLTRDGAGWRVDGREPVASPSPVLEVVK